MDVLVLGANGLLGSNVISECQRRQMDVSGTYHATEPSFSIPLYQLDIRNQEHVRRIVERTAPTHIVNCAAMTDVDECETEPELAYDINGEAPAALAELCADQGIQFCHVSTDYVFDGDASSPYPESADTNPIQRYGGSKLEGERDVLEGHGNTLAEDLDEISDAFRS